MCRGQLPVWQREWPKLRTAGARLVTVAAEAEIGEARRYAEHLDFPTFVDTENSLARVLRFRAIPNGYLFSAAGVLLDEMVTRFDLLSEPSTVDLVRSWLGTGVAADKLRPRTGLDDATVRALDLFAEGERLRERGERTIGLARWHAAYRADPKSFVIRKQIWRALYPERFGERIDLDWQREQIAREEQVGFSAANPTLPPPVEEAAPVGREASV